MPSHQTEERESGDQGNFILSKLKRNCMHPYSHQNSQGPIVLEIRIYVIIRGGI